MQQQEVISIPSSQATENSQGNIQVKWQHASNGPNKQLQRSPPTIAQHTFLLVAYERFSEIDHLLGPEASLNTGKLKQFFVSCLMTNKTQRKSQIKREKVQSRHKHGDGWITGETKRESLGSLKMGIEHTKPTEFNEGSAKRGVYNCKCLH